MKRILLVTFFVLGLISALTAGDFTYVGVKKCKMCHKGEKKGNVYETWLGKRHAKAFESVKAKGQEQNPKCLKCHTTGFDKGGYKIGDTNAANFEGVQCEACHGAGSGYKKMSLMKDKAQAMKNGLIEPTEKVCVECHDAAQCKKAEGFNYAEAVKAIDHKYRK